MYHLRSFCRILAENGGSKLVYQGIELLQVALLSVTTIDLAELPYLFGVLEAFHKSLEADAWAWSGIDAVCVAGCPSTETCVAQRVFRPAVYCPTQISVLVGSHRMYTNPCRFGR